MRTTAPDSITESEGIGLGLSYSFESGLGGIVGLLADGGGLVGCKKKMC